ncbi:MAG: hypothetical protein KDD11_16405 [Acidobacteria bacterium]|nr:hypothetical protein [Acidobacteriota bacterium]
MSTSTAPQVPGTVDVIILGGGLAGLSLARQLLLAGGKRILLLEHEEVLPDPRQKVGESLVQVGGYYFSRVLDLEDHLLHEHFLKYNLRFYWPAPGRPGTGLEDYSQAYVRKLSNVTSYQLDRNRLEEELLRLNGEDPAFDLVLGARRLEVELADAGAPGADHRVTFETHGRRHEVAARWVVDATGRGRVLARQRQMTDPGTIRHGTFFFWVDGLVDVERLTALSRRDTRLAASRRHTGHLPYVLATNHFMGDGFWLWVIPLRHKTSFGVVFDRATFDHRRVAGPEAMIDWMCEEFPLFEHDLRQRKVVDWGGFKDFSHTCAATIDPARWAITGVAGRFSDPLYSPGSDLIALHNTLITAAIHAPEAELESRAALYERQMQAIFDAYIPSYAESYGVLGDPEAFSLKYTWELAVYFAFYVFPTLSDLWTDRRFALAHLRKFSELGPINKGVQRILAGFHRWKREHPGAADPPAEPVYFDFLALEPLACAETAFYEVGVSVEEARQVLAKQLDSLREMARFIGAHVASVVLGEPAAVHHRGFVESIDPRRLRFEPEEMARAWAERDAAGHDAGERYPWRLDPSLMDVFRAQSSADEEPQPVMATVGVAS